VALRQRLVKVVRAGKDRAVVVVAQARKGQLEAWTVIPVKRQYLQRQREGLLVYGRQG